MEKSFFFNSVDGDRKYLAEDFASYFSALLKNGVFLHEMDALKVLPDTGRQIVLQTGSAFINGYAYSNTTVLCKTLNIASANRIDRIALRLDMTERKITVVVKNGTAATSPIAPELIRTADIWELGLADVYVNAGAITITASDITDLRGDSNYCGGVTMLVDRDEILGDISNTFVAFTEATMRKNIETNENTSVIFGTIKKWFSDIKTLAFKDKITKADIEGGLITVVNSLNSTSETDALSAKQGYLINQRLNNMGFKTGTFQAPSGTISNNSFLKRQGNFVIGVLELNNCYFEAEQNGIVTAYLTRVKLSSGFEPLDEVCMYNGILEVILDSDAYKTPYKTICNVAQMPNGETQIVVFGKNLNKPMDVYFSFGYEAKPII